MALPPGEHENVFNNGEVFHSGKMFSTLSMLTNHAPIRARRPKPKNLAHGDGWP